MKSVREKGENKGGLKEVGRSGGGASRAYESVRNGEAGGPIGVGLEAGV